MIHYNYNHIKLSDKDKMPMVYVLQIVALYNAKLMGWKIEKIGNRKYMLSKKMILTDNELTNFLSELINTPGVI